MQAAPVCTIIVPLQCRLLCPYIKTEFPYYSVFAKILAMKVSFCKS